MSENFVQNPFLRSVAMTGLRKRAQVQFWRKGPRLFVNSIPKAGTHLLTAELEQITGLQKSWLHILGRPVLEDQHTAMPKLKEKKLRAYLSGVHGSQFFSSHLPWSPQLERILVEENIKTIFVLRDPRAIAVSLYHYIVGLERHALHDLFTAPGMDELARYRLIIDGHAGPPFVRSLLNTLEIFGPWVESDAALSVKFEDLVGSRGGGSDTVKREKLEQIADFADIGRAALPSINQGKTPTTPTLRKGKIDSWREELPQEAGELIMERCGAWIARMGYD